MPKIVVEVMPKAELLDPQGKAVAGALSRLGKSHFHDVRVGKRFEITTDREISAEVMEEVQTIADDLLANGVIEDVTSISVLPDDADADDIDADDAETLPVGAASDAQAHDNESAFAGTLSTDEAAGAGVRRGGMQ